MENNITWCGNFNVKTENKEIINNLQFASDLLFSLKEELIQYVCYQSDNIIVENDNKQIGIIDFHTFLFFQDYEKYLQLFNDFKKVNVDIILEDLFSKNTYLDFEQVNDKKKFFSQLLSFFNDNLFDSVVIHQKPNFIKKLLLSFAFKEVFQYGKTNFIIPEKYQEQFLSTISEEKVVLYNWNAFKKIFHTISDNVKDDYFIKKSKLEFLSPILKFAYSYSYNDKTNTIVYQPSKQVTVVRNNFEEFFMKNQNFFQKMSIEEQKVLFKIFIHYSRKQLFEYMFYNYPEIKKDNYSEQEYQDLKVKSQKHNINLDQYFLFKKLSQNLQPKNKEKRVKI